MEESSPESGEVYRPALVRGRYRVTEALHLGRHGDVVAATDNREDRDVVLKRIPNPDRADTSRLRAVHRVLEGLNHPAVMRVSELIETRSDLWLVSERVQGYELQDWWERLPLGAKATFAERWAHAGPILAALLDAIEALHSRQMAHLDIKPANILVNGAGEVTLVDVGLGRPPGEIDTRPTAEIRERAGFLAPELLDGLSTSRRADQWSLGAVIYQLLTGQKAVPGQTPSEIARSYRQGRVQPVRDWAPDTNPDLAAVVMRLLSWDPEARFPGMAALRAALGTHLTRPIRAPLQPWSAPRPPVVGVEALDTFFRRRLLELRAGQGCVLRVVDEEGTGKSTLLARWARRAQDDGNVEVLEASCLPGVSASALHRWFRPPATDPRSPPPQDLVAQALAQFTRPTVLLLDTLEEMDALVWARVQRSAAAAIDGSSPHALLLVLSGRALGGLDRWVAEDAPRLFNVGMPRLRAADVTHLIRPESQSEEDRQLAEVVAETHCRDSRGVPGTLFRTLLSEERSHRLRRDGAMWMPVMGELDLDAVEPAMPVILPQVYGYIEELGGTVEVELVLAALPFGRQMLLDALGWAETAGGLTFRLAANRWFLRLVDRGDVGVADLHATQATHAAAARWLERNGEFGGLAAERTARHWHRAGEPGRTADAYVRAAKASSMVGASSEARRLGQLSQSFDARRTGNTTPGTNPLGRNPNR